MQYRINKRTEYKNLNFETILKGLFWSTKHSHKNNWTAIGEEYPALRAYWTQHKIYGSYSAPYITTFHQVFIRVKNMKWHEPEILIKEPEDAQEHLMHMKRDNFEVNAAIW